LNLNDSKKVTIAVIHVLLLMGIALYFSETGNKPRPSFMIRDERQVLGVRGEISSDENQKELTQRIDTHLSILKEMEETVKKISAAESELKEEIAGPHPSDKRIEGLLDEISLLEDTLQRLTPFRSLSKGRLIPRMADGFIGRGPIIRSLHFHNS